MKEAEVKTLNGFTALSSEELEMVDGGEWNLRDFGKSMWEGSVAGGFAGAVYGGGGGTVALPGVGTVTGAAGGGAVGFIVGGVSTAVAYTVKELLYP